MSQDADKEITEQPIQTTTQTKTTTGSQIEVEKNKVQGDIDTESKAKDRIKNKNDKEKTDKRLCNCCFQEVPALAKVCHHCGQPQEWWQKLLQSSPIVVSIVMMVIAAVQLTLAFSERIDASDALGKAKSAAIDANHALVQVLSDANEIKHLKSKADKLHSLLEKNSKLTSALVEIQQKSVAINVFMMTVISAQNDDRQAYEQLSILEKDNQSPFQQHALNTKMNIRLQYGERLGSAGGLSSIAPQWKEGVDPNALTISQVIDEYNETSWYFHSGLIAYIWKRNDFSKKDRMQFLIDTLEKERNLKAVCIAQYLLSKEANIKFNPLVIEPLLEWWKENKHNFK